MAEFTPITTQEAFDAALGERLRRERETAAKRFEGWSSPDDVGKLESGYDDRIKSLEGELSTLRAEKEAQEKTLAERNQTIRAYESRSVKQRIAREVGLPIELAERLQGETEEDYRKDAEQLIGAVGSTRRAQPLATQEVRGGTDGSKAALRALAERL